MLNTLFKLLNRKTKVKYMKKINIEAFKTFSNSRKIVKLTNFNLYTNFEKGLEDFTKWFLNWKKNND